MSKKNNKVEKMIKINVVYNNFINKYTKKKYPLGETEVTEKRLAEILKLEKDRGIKLIEVIEENATNGDGENGDDKNVQTPEVGANDKDGANAGNENGEDGVNTPNADGDNQDGDNNNDAE